MRGYPLMPATAMCKNCMFAAILSLGIPQPSVVPVESDRS